MSLRDALAGVKQSQTDQDEAVMSDPPPPTKNSTPRPKATLRPRKLAAGSRVSGKSSNPDFEKIGVYVRTETRRKAERKWEDQAGGDLSDLIESLLSKYIRD
jgi:hypothetical protein